MRYPARSTSAEPSTFSSGGVHMTVAVVTIVGGCGSTGGPGSFGGSGFVGGSGSVGGSGFAGGSGLLLVGGGSFSRVGAPPLHADNPRTASTTSSAPAFPANAFAGPE